MNIQYYNVTSDMYKADANCNELTEQTAAVIDDDTLTALVCVNPAEQLRALH
jgi:hypothetical protein